MKRLIVLASICLFTSLSTFAQIWIPLTEKAEREKPCVEIIESNDVTYKFRVSISGLNDSIFTINDSTFHLLSIEDFQTLGEAGYPAFPAMTQLIALPKNSEFSYSLQDTVWTDISIGKIYPYQTPLLETETNSNFEIANQIYSSEQYAPEILTTGYIQCYGGIKNTTLSICPFKYYPTTNRLSILTNFTVSFYFEEIDNVDDATTNVSINTPTAIFNNFNDAIMGTYATNAAKSRTEVTEHKDYLIIGADTSLLNSSIVLEFCKWKAFKGFKCDVVSTKEIGNSPDSIKSYIKEQYKNGVKYVLFIGDSDSIPLYYYNSETKSDYWYGCLDGDLDLQPEVHIGRFCTNSILELTNMIKKSIEYEQNPPNSNIVKKSLMIAHKERPETKYQACLNEVCEKTYSKYNFEFIKLYGAKENVGGNNAKNIDIINNINSGVGIVNYRGHGSITGWQKNWSYDLEEFDSTKIDSLTNNYYPVVFSIACNNGDITSSNTKCLLEQFTKSEHGAVAFLGATKPSYTQPNHSFNKYLYEVICEKEVCNIGDINSIAHVLNIAKHNNSVYSQMNARIYLWGGDPSLELWTDSINEFNILFARGINNLNFNTNGIENSNVTIVSENGSTISNTTQSTSGTISIDSPSYLVFNKHNYKPYIMYYNTTDSIVQNKKLEIDAYFTAQNLHIGCDITDLQPVGNVIVKSGTNVKFENDSSITIKNGFICEKGATLTINAQ
jgi:hypothetical protein